MFSMVEESFFLERVFFTSRPRGLLVSQWIGRQGCGIFSICGHQLPLTNVLSVSVTKDV
jgi:sarcosine oxidase delta subunit